MASNSMNRLHPRGRFEEKLKLLGLEPWPDSNLTELFNYARETFALIRPLEAHLFFRVVADGEEVQVVAKDLKIRSRTAGRWLHDGRRKGDLGALDQFLVILELYREADYVRRGYAGTLFSCFTPTSLEQISPLYVPFHRALFEAVLEAFVGGYSKELETAFPWVQEDERQLVVAWPCFDHSTPLPRSLLPGLLAVMQKCQYDDLMWLCRLIVALILQQSSGGHHQNPTSTFAMTSWAELLRVLNTGRSTADSHGSVIPQTAFNQASEASRALLHSLPPALQYAALGILSRTPLPKEMLATYVSDTHFANLTVPQDVLYCVDRYRLLSDAQGAL